MNISNVESSGSPDCMLCGAREPFSHCMVRDGGNHLIVGRVCASHSIYELVIGGQGRFYVTVEEVNDV